jgi:hypothetical protein
MNKILTICAFIVIFFTQCNSSSKEDISTTSSDSVVTESVTTVIYPELISLDNDVSSFVFQVSEIGGRKVATDWLEDETIHYDAIKYYLDEFTLKDEKATYILMDTVANPSASHAPFYFHLLVKMLIDADGAVAQILGAKALSYVRNHPASFSAYFIDKQNEGRKKVFELFAAYLRDELRHEGDLAQGIAKFKADLKNTCTDCSELQLALLDKFCDKLGQ